MNYPNDYSADEVANVESAFAAQFGAAELIPDTHCHQCGRRKQHDLCPKCDFADVGGPI
jgi:hypothetical protein